MVFISELHRHERDLRKARPTSAMQEGLGRQTQCRPSRRKMLPIRPCDGDSSDGLIPPLQQAAEGVPRSLVVVSWPEGACRPGVNEANTTLSFCRRSGWWDHTIGGF